MERKSDKVRRMVAEGDFKSALAIAKGFRIGIRSEDWKQMTRAHECLTFPAFYSSIGMDPKAEIEKGIEIINRLYGRKENANGSDPR